MPYTTLRTSKMSDSPGFSIEIGDTPYSTLKMKDSLASNIDPQEIVDLIINEALTQNSNNPDKIRHKKVLAVKSANAVWLGTLPLVISSATGMTTPEKKRHSETILEKYISEGITQLERYSDKPVSLVFICALFKDNEEKSTHFEYIELRPDPEQHHSYVLIHANSRSLETDPLILNHLSTTLAQINIKISQAISCTPYENTQSGCGICAIETVLTRLMNYTEEKIEEHPTININGKTENIIRAKHAAVLQMTQNILLSLNINSGEMENFWKIDSSPTPSYIFPHALISSLLKEYYIVSNQVCAVNFELAAKIQERDEYAEEYFDRFEVTDLGSQPPSPPRSSPITLFGASKPKANPLTTIDSVLEDIAIYKEEATAQGQQKQIELLTRLDSLFRLKKDGLLTELSYANCVVRAVDETKQQGILQIPETLEEKIEALDIQNQTKERRMIV